MIARGREEDEPEGEMPWPLTRAEMESFEDFGLRRTSLDDFMNDEDPPVRRFRGFYTKPI